RSLGAILFHPIVTEITSTGFDLRIGLSSVEYSTCMYLHKVPTRETAPFALDGLTSVASKNLFSSSSLVISKILRLRQPTKQSSMYLLYCLTGLGLNVFL